MKSIHAEFEYRHECRSPRAVFGHDTPGLAQGDTSPNGAGPGGKGPSKGRGKPLAAVGAFVGPTRRRIGRLGRLENRTHALQQTTPSLDYRIRDSEQPTASGRSRPIVSKAASVSALVLGLKAPNQ